MTSAQTTLAAGTDNQAFCYDEQNRLTWATSQTGTGPCGAANTAGSLTAQGAQYTASYVYDALNRLTSSPLGTYAYASGHLHAASSVSSGSSTVYSAQYGTVGSMYCRAPDSTTTCTGGTFSGARMGYDHEGRLVSWQNTWSSPAATAAYAYDGAGQRLAQSVTSGGTTSTTYYVGGGLEELTVSGASSTLTKYEAIPGVCNVVIVGTGPSESISYVTSDGLGSVSEALDGSGHVTAQQLYGPYGGVRYSSGTMPTVKGFTGQYADAASSGLDYYNARYYDPTLGQFTSADTDAKGGLNRYAYVAGNPETLTDPTGHLFTCMTGCGGGGGGCTNNCGGNPTGGNGTGGGSGGCQSNCGGSGGCTSDASCGCYTSSCGGTPPSGPTGGNGTGGCNGGCNARMNSGGSCDTATAACVDAMNAKADALDAKNSFGDFQWLAALVVAAGGTSMGIKAFAALIKKVLLGEFAQGALYGATLIAGAEFLAFWWESNQNIQWFMDESNVENFFDYAEGVDTVVGLAGLTTTLVSAAMGAEFTPVFWGVLVSGTAATVPAMGKLLHERDRQLAAYQGGPPLNLVGTPCGDVLCNVA